VIDKIVDISTIITAPGGVNLAVVKVKTAQGVSGLGCATFTQRVLAVKTVVDDYLKPLLIGQNPDNINDLWQLIMQNAYWRSGPVLNNALSGIDMALWDIKGKKAGMPLYELLGGKCRGGVALYRHADGFRVEEVLDRVEEFKSMGYSHIRCQLGLYGGRGDLSNIPENCFSGTYYDPKAYRKSILLLFEKARERFGFDLELCHDVHERLTPADALQFARDLEPFRLFFLEDLLPTEQLQWFEKIRHQSSTPLAVGELFTGPGEWMSLITTRLIDFLRVHISHIGGITPAVKLASLADAFGVRTAWHGPPDLSPVGHSVNLHLSLVVPNFGIQEWAGYSPEVYEVFSGIAEVRKGYAYAADTPGIGIRLDEEAAAKYPFVSGNTEWTISRLPDGTLSKP